MKSSVLLILTVVMALGFQAQTALAQDNRKAGIPSFQIERMNPASGASDYIDVVSPMVVENLGFNAGGYLSYAKIPLEVNSPNAQAVTSAAVSSQVTLSLIGSIGFFDFMELGLLFPITLFQSADDPIGVISCQDAGGTPVCAERKDLASFALNDPRLSLKFEILDTFTDPVGLGVIVNTYFPLGNANTLTGDKGFSVEGLFLLEVNIWRNIRAAANLGYRWRQNKRVFRDAHMKDAIMWGLGFSLPLWFSSFDFLLEFEGSLNLAQNDNHRYLTAPGQRPAEARFAIRWGIIRHLTLTAGVGVEMSEKGIGSPDFRGFLGLDGRWVLTDRFTGNVDYDADNIRGDADLCPEVPEDFDGFEDEDGCPDPDNDGDGVDDLYDKCPDTPKGVVVNSDGCAENDTDGDGIPNNLDDCPDDPEDKDGFEDQDGCPDLDNDKDGIPDVQDKCPNVAENYNGFEDEDGCPDDPNARVKVGKDSLIIIEQVYFETAKAIIRPVSYSILDEVAKVLNDNPQILRVRVEGHTDSRGNDEMNMKLSQERAEAVMKYLVDHGVSASRLEAVGYGEERPIDDNETKEGRQKNRRVEFKMLQIKE